MKGIHSWAYRIQFHDFIIRNHMKCAVFQECTHTNALFVDVYFITIIKCPYIEKITAAYIFILAPVNKIPAYKKMLYS